MQSPVYIYRPTNTRTEAEQVEGGWQIAAIKDTFHMCQTFWLLFQPRSTEAVRKLWKTAFNLTVAVCEMASDLCVYSLISYFVFRISMFV